MTRSRLGPTDLARWMGAFQSALEDHKDTINRLNVYPVPDGDTGTNMLLTLESVNRELEGLGEGAGMAATAKAVSHGSLMGARGNSGVILCQILRGVASACAAGEEVGATDLARGLAEANAAARAGVMRPVEGTILTVAASAAEAATATVAEAATAEAATAEAAAAEADPVGGDPPGEAGPPPGGASLLAVAEAARRAAGEALRKTPEMLPVLARAGVVDAGGAGLVLFFDALLTVVDGRPLPTELPLPESVVAVLADGLATTADGFGPLGPSAGGPGGPASRTGGLEALADEAHAGGGGADVSSLRYEVMYFLEAPDESVPAFREVWAGIGDSIVVVGGDGLWNCHIHTDDIGAAVEAGVDAGRPRQIRVTDLLEQVEEESWVRRASESGAAPPEPPLGPPPVTSVVAVATGDGIRRIFHSFGVRHVVAGGQSMNPSTAQILEMIEAAPGEEVVVLPNNKNIAPVAAQACEIAGKPAFVIETPGIQEGFAALLEYDPEAPAASNVTAMRAAAARVMAGEVTQAVRASDTPAGKVEAGDWIGLSRTGIEAVCDSPSAATIGLLSVLLNDEHEIVTIIEGSGATPAETRRVTEWLAAEHPSVAVELHHGGQPLYPYLVAAE